MNKKLFFSVFILMSFAFLFSFEKKEEEISIIKNKIVETIPKNSTVFLNCEINDWNIISFLIEKGYSVVDKKKENAFIIDIKRLKKTIKKEKKILLIKKQNNYEEINITCKIVEPQTSKILYYNKFKYTKKRNENNSNWYEPVLITTIIGGLAYLFYFGTN